MRLYSLFYRKTIERPELETTETYDKFIGAFSMKQMAIDAASKIIIDALTERKDAVLKTEPPKVISDFLVWQYNKTCSSLEKLISFDEIGDIASKAGGEGIEYINVIKALRLLENSGYLENKYFEAGLEMRYATYRFVGAFFIIETELNEALGV